jgi:acetolactate synthase-1/3 small subunit
VDQVEKQLDRLIEVVEVSDLTEAERVQRELVIGRTNTSAHPVLAERRARVIESNGHGVVFEFVGSEAETQALIENLKRHGLRELTRSGPVAVKR